jgi:CheY-like chemotaxis protein
MGVILVVEDDVFIREIAEMMIQDWGHDTLAASDAGEALAFLRSAQHSTHSSPISISKIRSLPGASLRTRRSSFGRICASSTRLETSSPTR